MIRIRIATRQSALALAQTRWVAAEIRRLDAAATIEEVHVVTEGDRVLDRPLAAIGGKGLFVSEVEAALTSGRADLAVHSLKDVPAALAPGLSIVCVPPREDPRDALVTPDGSELDALPSGARVGTSSLRRACQLRQRRPDLEYASLRGNVDTRLRRLDEGKFHAVVLAIAGLRRLGLASRPHWLVPREICIPSVGQGCLALEARTDDAALRALLAPLEDRRARLEMETERAFLGRLGAGCTAPVAGSAELRDGGARLAFDGFVGSIDGSEILSGGAECFLDGRDPEAALAAARALGVEAAEGLLERGAARLLQEADAAVARQKVKGNGGGKPLGSG